ncbi:MAG TPA: tetratricopeptide repeat protein [Bacteroidales bacterium]|nr:tetratricopeptide repeat protein [Bacteroidales bacterium]
MRINKTLSFILLITSLIVSGCGKTQKVHQEAYDLSEVGNYQGALELYEQLLDKKPDKSLFLNDYGWALFMADSLQRAEQVLMEAKKKSKEGNTLLKRTINKNLMIVRAFMEAKNYLEQGNAGKARNIYDNLNKSWKARDMRLKYYALAYESLGEQAKANEYWQQIVDKYAQADFDSHFYDLAVRKIKMD